MRHLERRIEAIAQRVHESIRVLYEASGVIEPDSSLSQLGLRDGITVVRDYLEHREWGLALEHLLYMVSETGVPVTPNDRADLTKIAESMDLTERVAEIRQIP